MRLIFLALSSCRSFAQGFDLEPTDRLAYRELKADCEHVVYTIHRNLHIYPWSDATIKELLKNHFEDYLLEVDTPEARQLLSQYQTMDWDVQKMMEFHWSEL